MQDDRHLPFDHGHERLEHEIAIESVYARVACTRRLSLRVRLRIAEEVAQLVEVFRVVLLTILLRVFVKRQAFERSTAKPWKAKMSAVTQVNLIRPTWRGGFGYHRLPVVIRWLRDRRLEV